MKFFTVMIGIGMLLVMGCAQADGSFYQLPDVQLQDQDGHQFSLASLAGTPRLIGMFYSSCTDICPYEIEQVDQFEKALQEDHHAVLPAILISMDPADGLATLQQVAAKHHLSGTSLSLVRIIQGDLGMLEGVLGVHARSLGMHAFAHEPVLTLFDGDGHVRAQVQASVLNQPQVRARLLHE